MKADAVRLVVEMAVITLLITMMGILIIPSEDEL